MRTSVALEGPVVDRPIEEVFAFISDLENSTRWGRTKKTVKDADSPDGAGAVFQEEARILGEKVQNRSEITSLDPPKEFAYTSSFENGVIERTRVNLVAVDGGTRVDIATDVDIDRIPRVAAPLVSLVVKQRLAARFRRLERVFKPPERSVEGAALLVAIGVMLVATAGMRYLIEVLPEGEWWAVLGLVASALVAAVAAGVLWRAGRRSSAAQRSEGTAAEAGTPEADR